MHTLGDIISNSGTGLGYRADRGDTKALSVYQLIFWVLYIENNYQPSHYGVKTLLGLSLVGLPCFEGTLKAGQAEKN